MTTFVVILMVSLGVPLAFFFAVIFMAWFGYYER